MSCQRQHDLAIMMMIIKKTTVKIIMNRKNGL